MLITISYGSRFKFFAASAHLSDPLMCVFFVVITDALNFFISSLIFLLSVAIKTLGNLFNSSQICWIKVFLLIFFKTLFGSLEEFSQEELDLIYEDWEYHLSSIGKRSRSMVIAKKYNASIRVIQLLGKKWDRENKIK